MNMTELNHGLQEAFSGTPTLWLGSQSSFDVVVEAQRQVSLLTPEKMLELQARAGNVDENGLPMMWEKRGATAVLNVKGSLIDGNAGYGRYFGVVGYDDIAEAAIAAYSDPDVKSVLTQVESPGGQVSGVMDCGLLLNQLSLLKPSAAYSGNLVASGGYWLASSIQGTFSVGPTSEVGSIGVLMVLTDLTEALKQMGIKKTVMRAGDQKARVNPFEPLTDDARARLQQNMDDVHALFRAQVAKGRPGLSNEALLAATDGGTFLGKRAKAAGLVDKVSSFEQALKLLDSQNPAGNTPSNSKGVTMKTVLTTEQIAKISAGVKIDQLGLSAEDLAALTVELQEEAKAAVDAKAIADKKVSDDAAAAKLIADAAGGDTDAAKLKIDLAAANAQIDLLKSQSTTAQSQLIAKEAELVNLKATTQTMTTNHEGLMSIARSAVARMTIGLGGSGETAEGLSVEAVLAEHARLDAVFLEKFKPGAASKGAAGENDADQVKVTPQLRRFTQVAQAAQNSRAK